MDKKPVEPPKNDSLGTAEEGGGFSVNVAGMKPFLGAFLVLIAILVGYYFLWDNARGKVEIAVKDALRDYKYDSISASGFPFKKTITIKNLVFSNDKTLINKSQVIIGQGIVTSFIFSGTMSVEVSDIRIIDPKEKKSYNLSFNEKPTIKFSLYSDGRLEGITYVDRGYKVADGEDAVYSAGDMTVNVESVRNGGTIDYAINGKALDIKGLSVLNVPKDTKKDDDSIPYNISYEISASVVNDDDDGSLIERIIKITAFEVLKGEEREVGITADLTTAGGDSSTFGSVSIVIENYKKLLEYYQGEIVKSIRSGEGLQQTVDKNTQDNYVSATNIFFKTLFDVIDKNPKTVKNKTGVLVLRRDKGSFSYYLNDQDINSLLYQLSLSM